MKNSARLIERRRAVTNNDTPWAERWPEPEFDHQGWEEVMSELSNMAGDIAKNTPKVTKEDLESGEK